MCFWSWQAPNLDTIDRLGSIQGAAKELKMIYWEIWGRIKATEERLKQPLLFRNIGGTGEEYPG